MQYKILQQRSIICLQHNIYVHVIRNLKKPLRNDEDTTK